MQMYENAAIYKKRTTTQKKLYNDDDIDDDKDDESFVDCRHCVDSNTFQVAC